MENEVTNCNDCPFKGFGGWEGEVSICNIKEGKQIPADKKLFGEITKIPTWCPLKKNVIIVKLKSSKKKSKNPFKEIWFEAAKIAIPQIYCPKDIEVIFDEENKEVHLKSKKI